MGRYICAKKKIVNVPKANNVCLLKRCPYLQVRYKQGKYKQVVPITMIEQKGC